MDFILPTRIHADGLLPFLSLLDEAGAHEEIALDFSQLQRVSPAGLTALVAKVVDWRRLHRKVSFVNLASCSIAGYLQRMDILKNCGIIHPEEFKRHDSKGRFVPVCLIDHQIDKMGADIAGCLAPGGEEYEHPKSNLYDFAWYVLTETANNVRQHSGGLGYAAAQVSRNEGLVKISIADNGKGIRQSFRDAGLSWSHHLNDGEAILKSLQPRISSRGRPSNEGVGLTLVSELVRLTQGWLLIVSGAGVVRISRGGTTHVSQLPDGTVWKGTLVALTFEQKAVQDFPRLLTDAKVHAGLL